MSLRLPRRRLRLVVIVIIFIFFLKITMIMHRFNSDDNVSTIEIPDTEHDQEKIDWHNYTQIAEDKKRTGPGENGYALENHKGPDNLVYQSLYQSNGFNAYASDQISLHRSIPDIRHPDCRNMKYRRKLPSVSVIIPFHEEHLTTLQRTVVSVLDRAPSHLMKEIILVDDASTKDFLGKTLETFVSTISKVKLIRLKERSGLIRTRLAGATRATGDVIIFLDSHVEANVNWLPPLLEPIAENYKTVVCPFIDVLDMETFKYIAQDEGRRGAFNWFLLYKRLPRLPADDEHPAEPFESPVMAGGLFAMSRRWFWELGGYDPGLEIWGGEQYELSFKIWMCGGRMVDAPCSRIGHVYRRFMPFSAGKKGNFLLYNHKRVAEVWMDEYKNYIYDRQPQYLAVDEGDLTAQKQIRTKLQCRTFDWYMKEIAFDLVKSYPLNMPGNGAEGHVWNRKGSERTCLTAASGIVRFEPCQDKTQKLLFDWRGTIRPFDMPDMCFDSHLGLGSTPPIKLVPCHNMGGNQKWQLSDSKIIHETTRLCLEISRTRNIIILSHCFKRRQSQIWKWSKFSRNNISEAFRQSV